MRLGQRPGERDAGGRSRPRCTPATVPSLPCRGDRTARTAGDPRIRAGRSSSALSVEPVSRDVAADRVGHEVAHRSTRGDPAAERARADSERRRIEPFAAHAAPTGTAQSGTRRDREGGEERWRGFAPAGKVHEAVLLEQQEPFGARIPTGQFAQRLDGVRGSPPLHFQRQHPESRVARTASRVIARRWTPGVSARPRL